MPCTRDDPCFGNAKIPGDHFRGSRIDEPVFTAPEHERRDIRSLGHLAPELPHIRAPVVRYLNRMLEDSWSSQRKGIAAQGFGCDPRRVPIHPSHKIAMQETSTACNRWEHKTYSGQAQRCQPLPPDARPGVRRRNQYQTSDSRWLKCREPQSSRSAIRTAHQVAT